MSDKASLYTVSDSGCAEEVEGDHGQDYNGDWCTIGQKKTKKTAVESEAKSGNNAANKKKKSAVTLSLQEFFSDSGSNQASRTGSRQRSTSLSSSEEASVLMASLHTLYSDNLRRMGPVRLDDPRLHQITAACSDEGRKMMSQRFPSLAAFLAHCPDLQLVDNFVCVRTDVKKAVFMATEAVHVAMMAQTQQKQFAPLIRSDSASPSLTPTSAASTPPPPLSSIHWPIRNSDSPSFPSISSSLSQHSLDSNSPDLVHPTPIGPRPPSSLPGSASSPSSGFGSIGTASTLLPHSGGFGGIGTAAVKDDAHLRATVDELNKRIQILVKSNSEFSAKLEEKDREIEKLNQIIASQEERLERSNHIQLEVQTTQQMLNKLNLSNGHETIRDSDLVIFLQKQLESEKLNSQNLRRQLEMERKQSCDLICPPRPTSSSSSGLKRPDPIGSPAPQLLPGLPAIGRGPSQPIASGPFSLGALTGSSGDALGLRGILELASSSLSNGGAAPAPTPLMSTPPPSLTSPPPPLPLMSCPPPPLPAATASTAATSSTSTTITKAPSDQQRTLEGLLVHFPGMTDVELHRHLQQLRAVHGRLSGLPLSAVVRMIKDQAEKQKAIH